MLTLRFTKPALKTIRKMPAGIHPQRVWRDYRGVTLQTLAESLRLNLLIL